jgi:GTPase
MLRRLKAATTSLQAQMTKLYLHEDGDPSAKMADGVSSETSKRGPYGSWIVRIVPSKAEEIVEVRVAVVGNVDSGKSTLTGVLTRGGLDDGRGKVSLDIDYMLGSGRSTRYDRQTRVALFRHKHELETGRTSSVGLEVRSH